MEVFPANETLRQHRVVVHEISTDIPSTYPSAYWGAVGATFPTVKYNEVTSQVAYARLTDNIRNHIWDELRVTTFMIQYMTEAATDFEQHIEVDWPLELGNVMANNDITPLDLLNITPVDPTGGDAPNIASDPKDRKSLFFALVMLYRKNLTRGVDATYSETINAKLNDHFKAHYNVSEDHITATSGYIKDVDKAVEYKRILCVLDMFYFKFPDHKLANIRMGTIPTRYRGCIALTLLHQVARAAGIKSGELILFTFTNPVAIDAVAVQKVELRKEDPHAFFPYHLELGLVKKSVYSLSAVPTYVLWLHCIGAMLGLTRCLNARLPLAHNIGGTCESGFVVGLRLGSGVSISREFGRTAALAQEYNQRREAMIEAEALLDLMENDDEDGEAPADVPAAPVVPQVPADQPNANIPGDPRTPQEKMIDSVIAKAFEKYYMNGGLSPAERRQVAAKAMGWRNYPEGSVGQYLYQAYGRAAVIE